MTNQRSPLTDRERDVLRALAVGRTYVQTASELGVSVNTIRVHVRSIYAKLAVRSKTAAVVMALRHRWVQS